LTFLGFSEVSGERLYAKERRRSSKLELVNLLVIVFSPDAVSAN